MNKVVKKSLYVFLVCLLCFTNISVSATPGKLRSASIITCNGVKYGRHGNGHWHKAVKHDAGYYPVGSPVTPPCINDSTNYSKKHTTKSSKKSTTNRKSNNNSKSSTDTRKQVNLNIKSIKIDGKEIKNFKNNMKYTVYKDSISLDVIPSSDNAVVNIDGDMDYLELDKVNVIKITISNEGEKKVYKLNIIRKIDLETENIDILVNNKKVNLNTNSSIIVKNKNIDFSFFKNDDINIKILKNNKEINDYNDYLEDDTTYQVVVTTKDNQTKTYDLSVKYENDTTGEITKEETTKKESKSNDFKEVEVILTIPFIILGVILLKKIFE